MKYNGSPGEVWKGLIGWPYEVSNLGHIRRKHAKRLILPYWDKQGFGSVTMKRGPYATEFYLDSIIAAVWTSKPIDGARPLHIDGLPWNNWPTNLMWGLSMNLPNGDNIVTNWTCWEKCKLRHGPYTARDILVSIARPGDVLIGRNPKRQIVSFEIMWTRNRAMSPRNPFDVAKEYRATAKMHDSQFWHIAMLDAAEIIESLAINILERITDGHMEQVQLDQHKNAGFTNGGGIRRRSISGITRRPIGRMESPIQGTLT
jgi:hypothetical protein